MELGIPYAFLGPDGTRAVVGNSDEAKADPDWIGILDADNPPSISRAIRGSDEPLIEADGAIAGDRYHSGATLVFRGALDPNVGIEVVNTFEQKLRRATRAMRADGICRFQPSGYPERAFWFRRDQDPDIAGRRPKTFMVQLAAANAYGLSPDEFQQAIIPGAIGGEIGVISPVTSPVTSAIATTGQGNVSQLGDVATWPRFRVTGPITNPRIVDNTHGREIRFIYTLAAGETLDIYPALGRVLLNGTNDRYSAYDRPASKWWMLEPGVTDIRLLATAFSAGATLTVYWRNAWE